MTQEFHAEDLHVGRKTGSSLSVMVFSHKKIIQL